MYGIKHSSLTTQKESGSLKGFLRKFIYFLLLNWSPRNAVLSRETGIMSSKSRTCALVAKTKHMRDTFAPTHSLGSYLRCWPWKAGVSGFLPGYSGLPGESGFNPDTPGHKASTAIFWVRGYKSPLHPFIYSLSLPFSS
jgi:hypothetical protein